MLRVRAVDSLLRGNDAVVLFARVAKNTLQIMSILLMQFGVARWEVYTSPFKPLWPRRHSRGCGNLNRKIGALTIPHIDKLRRNVPSALCIIHQPLS